MLIISDFKGSFPGMLAEREFNIVCVTKNKGTGMEVVEKFGKEAGFTGKKVVVKF